jgi:murein DD-endopeptidase MepM/ murein hydrolase activator NlpD
MDAVFAGGKHFDSPCDTTPKDCQEYPIIDNPASGTWRKQFIPCTLGKAIDDDCANIEVRRRGGEEAQNNIRWMSRLQKEKEGNFLCEKGPVGRHPFGPNPRVVIEDLKENGNHKKVMPYPRGDKLAEAEFALYFSVDGGLGLISASCFGPVPLPYFSRRKEGQLVLFGLDSGKTDKTISSLISGVQNPGSGGGGGPSDFAGGLNLPVPVTCNGNSTSNFIRPTPGPVVSGFGWRRHPVLGTQRLHAGVDLGDAIGTPIVASNCGTVSFAGWAGGYGNYTCISHGSGVETCYAHQSSIAVKTGDTVKKGQYIGNVGSTGLSTGPHLHFELRINGAPVDPANYVRF